MLNTINYGYGSSQWKDRLSSYNGQSISYDAMGNPTSYLGSTLSWSGKQLTSYLNGSTSVSYSYNEDGLRLRKTVNSTDTEYYYNGSVLMYMITGSGSTAVKQRFSYDAAGNVAAVVYKNGSSTAYTYYYIRNAQGDIVKLIDSSGNTVVEYTYDSWGRIIATTGSLANTVGADQPFRYRGYVYDEETGWYYLHRYYDPTTCRFISADVLLSTGQGVLGHNSFAYCGNNPIKRSDPTGCNWWDDAWDWVKGAAETVSEVVTSIIDFTIIIEDDYESTVTDILGIGVSEGVVNSYDTKEHSSIITGYLSFSPDSIIPSFGISLDVGVASIDASVGKGQISIGGSYRETGISISAGKDDISVTQSVSTQKGKLTTKVYTKYYIKTLTLAVATVAVVAVVASDGLATPAVASFVYAMVQ